ncbi:MAG TPA: polysaccharide deacetylase family protein [Anaerolineales bacterium]|nr:polysaccharide deacetylase family protein [Anaerolineales bacterium]
MPVSPRVLFSIDYEPVFALFRHYDHITDAKTRRDMDDGFTQRALDPILEKLGGSKASIYLVGEIAEWYPDVPQRIVAAGHELGLHCQFHRPLVKVNQLADDLRDSSSWCRQYHVQGYRAPMIGIREEAYSLLKSFGFQYSSSIYAPAGTLLQKGDVWEIPVSTLRMRGGSENYLAPRDFSLKLLLDGEFPYGSSFSIGLMGRKILSIIEDELKRGHSPVIIMHPYELVNPGSSARLTRDLILNPLFVPFLWDKSSFLANLLRNFPISPLGTFLEETVASNA